MLYHSLGIGHKIISLKSTGTRGVSVDGDVAVVFHTAVHFRNIETRLMRMRYAGGLGNFEAQFGEHIMLFGATDRICLKGKIDSRCATVRKFLRFGFGRTQRKSYRQNWRLGDATMPGAT